MKFILALALLAVPATSLAQLSIQPAVLQVDASSAERRSTVRLTNHGARAQQVQFYAQDFAQDSVGDYRYAPPGSLAGSCGARLHVSPSESLVQPGQTQEVIVTVREAAAACWAMIMFETVTTDGAGHRIGQRLGAKLLSGSRAAKRNVEVENTEAAIRGDSVAVTFTASNPEDVPLQVSGRVELRPLTGAGASVTVPILSFGVLPGHAHRRTLDVPRPLSGDHVVVVVLDFGGEYLAGDQALLRVP